MMMETTPYVAVLAMPVSEERDHIKGPPDAPATLVEYGDYECPFCGAAHRSVTAVQAVLGDSLRFVFRNFPITTAHPQRSASGGGGRSRGSAGEVLGDA